MALRHLGAGATGSGPGAGYRPWRSVRLGVAA